VKGKPWSVDEERQLRKLREDGKTVAEIASRIKKSEGAVKQKLARLGMKQVVVTSQNSVVTTTSELIIPEELPSVEDQLKVLAAALDELKRPDLEQNDVLRLRTVIQGVKTYKELFVDYVNYRALEHKVEELISELERDREKSSGVARK
jgi:hypothetical protein